MKSSPDIDHIFEVQPSHCSTTVVSSDGMIASTNRHKRQKTHPAQHIRNIDDSPNLEDETASSKTVKAARRKARRLAALPGLPLDVLFEIFGHLHPHDLLKLSRMTKDFRRLLLSKSSLSVWKDCLANVPDLPASFPGMSEVAWVNLAFSPHCHICLTSNIRAVEWRFRLRICSKCAKDRLKEFVRMPIFDRNYRAQLDDIIPTRRAKRGRVVCLASDFDNVTTEYKAIQDAESRERYIKEKNTALTNFLKHAKLCELWEGSQVRDRDAELRQLKEERLASIEKKLIELGWGEDVRGIKHPDSLARHKLVNRPQHLTERIWTNIKPGIIECMEKMRVKRLKRELDQLHAKRQSIAVDAIRVFRESKLTENLMPNRLDFWQFECIKEIVCSPPDINVTVASFDDVVRQFPKLVDEWRQSVDKKMRQIIKDAPGDERNVLNYDEFSEEYYHKTEKTYPNRNLSEDQLSKKLSLASTVFRCYRCRPLDNFCADLYDSDGWGSSWQPPSIPLFYPHVLGHHCLTLHKPSYFTGLYNPLCKTWSCSTLALDRPLSQCAEELIKLAGQDPELTTADDMDELNLRFLCRLCPQKKDELEEPTLPLFHWRSAVLHQHEKHAGKISYLIVKESELDKEVTTAENDYRTGAAIWRCIHCYGTHRDDHKPMTIDRVTKHFANGIHQGISSPVLHRDYYEDFAAPNILAESHTNATIFVRCLETGDFKLVKDSNQPASAETDSDNEDYYGFFY